MAGLMPFIESYDRTIPVSMGLCDRVMANCYANSSYDPTRNGSCPLLVRQFAVGYYWEAGGGGRGPLPRVRIRYPFPTYDQSQTFQADIQLAVNTTLDYSI